MYCTSHEILCRHHRNIRNLHTYYFEEEDRMSEDQFYSFLKQNSLCRNNVVYSSDAQVFHNTFPLCFLIPKRCLFSSELLDLLSKTSLLFIDAVGVSYSNISYFRVCPQPQHTHQTRIRRTLVITSYLLVRW